MDETHAWILPHYYQPLWWEMEDVQTHYNSGGCSDDAMRQILRSVLFIDSLKYNVIGDNKRDEDDIYHLVSLHIIQLQTG